MTTMPVTNEGGLVGNGGGPVDNGRGLCRTQLTNRHKFTLLQTLSSRYIALHSFYFPFTFKSMHKLTCCRQLLHLSSLSHHAR
jgi:hypothetical protein